MPRLSNLRSLACLAVCALLAIGCESDRPPPQAQFVRQTQWAERGVWLKADTHVHTRFSDGGVDLQEVVRQAIANGCDVLAITDHGDAELDATSDAYFAALEQARRDAPELILLAGLEWNVPPWKGREHATLLVPPGAFERQTLREFQTLFDDWNRSDRDPDLALHALDWLEMRPSGSGALPLVIYNHPSRKRDDPDEFVEELGRWFQHSELVVGFEGGPGHQDSQPIGSYRQSLKTIDRWDPAAAELGGAWDKLLQKGQPVWGAVATSDFHSANPDRPDDFWPGQFSETWLYAPNRSPAGVLAALKAGSFFGVHGRIAREAQLTAWCDGLDRPAIAGEALRVPEGAVVEVALTFDQPLLDWRDRANEVHEVELIAVLPDEVKLIASQRPKLLGKALDVSLLMPDVDVAIRARGRRTVAAGEDLLFYTNPIQLYAAGNKLPAPDPALPTASVPVSLSSGAHTASIAGKGAARDPRLAPAWLVLAFATGGGACLTLLVQWQVEVRRRFARSDQPLPAVSHTVPLSLRRHLLAALVGFVFLAVYGSWVPLVPADVDWATAVRRFQQTLHQPLSFESRMDWTTNVVLFVPIGFFATGLLLGRSPSDRRRVTALPIVVLGCTLLSLVIEFGQLWIDDRTCSQNDIVAESLGALAGGIGWLIGGSVVVRWLDRLRDANRPRQQIERALELYLLVVAAYMLLPMDLTLRPAELWRKFQEGRIQFVPFVDLLGNAPAITSALAGAMLLLPVGVLVALWRWPDPRTVRPLGQSLLLGLAIVAGLEAGQALVYSRHSSATDLLGGLAAIAAGWVLLQAVVSPQPRHDSRSRPAGRIAALLAAAILFAALLAVVFCLPYDRVASGSEASERLSAMLARSPLEALYWGTPLNAVFEVLRKLLLFGVLGGLLGLLPAAAGWTASRPALSLIVGWLTATGLAAGIEILQAWLPPHMPDFTDILLAATGAAIGLLAVHRFGRRR